jgi:8-hydroxy-5-deazaflavin:NADPH oxidoreductase
MGGRPENVAVIGGTGDLGFGLALRWAQAGLKVIIGSRDTGRAEAAAERLRQAVPDAGAEGRANFDAAAASETVVVAVPFAGQAAIYKSIADSISEDAVVVDCTVPLSNATGGRATRVLGVWEGSAAQQAAGILRGRGRVCSAFHTLAASELERLDDALDEDVLVCGSNRDAKQTVRGLVEAIPGLRYVDAGPLESARIVEPLTALLIGINRRYETVSGIRVTRLPER